MPSKLEIRAFSDEKRQQQTGTFSVQINPEKIRRSYANVYRALKPAGAADTIQQFAGIGESSLDLEFTIDATGVIPGVDSVPERVRALRRLVSSYKGPIHRPPYLKVAWGGQDVFDCAFVSMDIDYTLFMPSGTPLRAKVSMRLKKSIGADTLVREAAASSPDLTHHRVVREGDTLPLLCESVYKEDRHYPRVARFNNLDTVMTLAPGHRVRLPPLRD